MRIVSNKYFVLIAFLLGVLHDMAAGPKAPPEPDANAVVAMEGPQPPGFSIDENIFVLLIVALFLGTYIVYKHKLKIKTPM